MASDREIRQQELARLLLQKAGQDLALVANVSDSEAVADEIVGFHIQQAIEKAIKAVLTRLGIQYEYTHDLALLYQQIENAQTNPPASLEEVEEFTAFAVQFRYTLYQTPSFDRNAGAQLAKNFIEWAHALVEAPLS
jgi:HEPN domain-containing protein